MIQCVCNKKATLSGITPGCYLGVTWVLPGWCYLGVTWVLPGCYLGVTWVLPGCYLGVN
jgi:hypothetical protein